MKTLPAFVLGVFLAYPLIAAEPPLYRYPAPAEIMLEDILPAAMEYLSEPSYVPGMKAGEKVLIVSDRSVDPLTKEAFYVAAWRLGASQVDIVVLQGRLDVKDPADIILQIFETDWWPGWLWDAAATYDRVIPLAYVNPVNLFEAFNVPGEGWRNKWASDTNTIYHILWVTHQ